MTERENLLEVIKHSGNAQWIPIVGDGIIFIKSSVDRDRPPVPQDGYDWFGCYWVFDNAIGGYAQPPESQYPMIVDDITEWKDKVKFPDLDSIDWAAAAEKDLKGFDCEKMLLLKTESGTFERLHQLYGFENSFIAMYEEPEAFAEFMNAIADFRIKFYDKLITYYKPDILFVMDGLGSICVGTAVDKLGIHRIMRLEAIVMMAAAGLLCFGVSSGVYPLILAGLLVGGFAYGGSSSSYAAAIKNRFGPRYYALNFSISSLDIGIAALLESGSGSLLDATGGYLAVMLMVLCLAVSALLLSLFSKKAKI